MKTVTAVISAILLLGTVTSFASAEEVPSWIKNNAAWWADGTISETEFVTGIQYLIKEGILVVPPTKTTNEDVQQNIPEWIKNNAAWWADGTISDSEFLNGIQHLIKIGIVKVTVSEDVASNQKSSTNNDSELAKLEAELEECGEIKKAYQKLNCEKAVKHEIEAYKIRADGQAYQVGPLTYYWAGLGTDGNSLEISERGQALLSVRLLAVHNGSADNVSMMCTGPSVCNYDVWNGEKAYKYSGMDFTNGQIIVKPGESAIFNMLFGPNIGYGGTTFEYNSGKDYYFRINEPYGSASIPLNLG